MKCARIPMMLALAVATWSGGAHAACTTATAACLEPVAVGDGRAFVYRTHALETRNEAITRALVMVHGQGRNADGYFRSAVAAGFLAGALEDAVIVAPRFASNEGNCRDTLAPQELNWTCAGPSSWRSGGAAVSNPAVTSFDVGDAIVRRLARKDVFPNLKTIVVAGHSAGGQYATRYAMANQIHEQAGVPITYIVANPSSYTYPDSLRPSASAYPANVAAAAPGYSVPLPAKPPPPYGRFADAPNCTTYDTWPYGFQSRVGYTAKLSDAQLKKQLTTRPTLYLLGVLDILPLYGFDGSCAAMAQGPTRLARGLAYARYLNENHGARHRTEVVPACGHSARCMFTHENVLPILFPRD